MTIEEIEAEVAALGLSHWDEDMAWEIGRRLVDLARARDLPVVIDIRDAGRCHFHAALPGSQALNDLWARRKSATTLVTGRASLAVGMENREKGRTLADNGLDPMTHADHGGAVPLRVGGAMVAVVTVSGLPQVEDHRLVMDVLKKL